MSSQKRRTWAPRSPASQVPRSGRESGLCPHQRYPQVAGAGQWAGRPPVAVAGRAQLSMSPAQSGMASASQAMAPWLTKPFGSSKLAAAIRSNASSRAGVASLTSSSSLPWPNEPLPPPVPAADSPLDRSSPPDRRLGKLPGTADGLAASTYRPSGRRVVAGSGDWSCRQLGGSGAGHVLMALVEGETSDS
jgi:hypothetical protein